MTNNFSIGSHLLCAGYLCIPVNSQKCLGRFSYIARKLIHSCLAFSCLFHEPEQYLSRINFIRYQGKALLSALCDTEESDGVRQFKVRATGREDGKEEMNHMVKM